MKITDVTLTLFAWESIPSTIYGHHTARPTGKSDLGLLAVTTDEGITGPCLSRHLVQPGEPRRAGADPLSEADPDGSGPARPRAPQPPPMGARPGRDGAGDRRLRHRAVGHRRQGRRDADPPADRHLPRQDRRLCQLRDPRHAGGLCRAGPALPIDRLARLQDPSAAILARRHQGLRGGAQGGRRRLHGDAQFDLELPLRGGAQGRPGDRGDGVLLVRGPARRPGHLQLRQAASRSSTSRSSPPNTRSAGSILTSRGSSSAPPIFCAAMSRSRAASPP